MLLFFRFFLLIVTGHFRRRIGLLGESVVHFTVLPNDCDLNFHLNGGRFVSFMDIARIDLLARARLFLPIIRRGWRPIMGGATIHYRRSIGPFERFAVRSRVLGWDEKWFYIEHVVEREGKVCATGTMRTLIRRAGGNVSPGEVLELAGTPELTSPPLDEFVTRWRAAEDLR